MERRYQHKFCYNPDTLYFRGDGAQVHNLADESKGLGCGKSFFYHICATRLLYALSFFLT